MRPRPSRSGTAPRAIRCAAGLCAGRKLRHESTAMSRPSANTAPHLPMTSAARDAGRREQRLERAALALAGGGVEGGVERAVQHRHQHEDRHDVGHLRGARGVVGDVVLVDAA